MMQLCMYKGPGNDLGQKIGHFVTCKVTHSIYSHCELEIAGTCWTSSIRDKGVRGKVIDLASGHWDVFPLKGLYAPETVAKFAEAWFKAHEGEPYDWMGAVRFLRPLAWLPQDPRARFCSEAVASALGIRRASRLSPQSLLDHLRSLQLVDASPLEYS